MRKYIQLFLVIITILSVLLLMIYERKYSKLSVVFQVMNGFISRDADQACETKLSTLKGIYRTDLLVPNEIVGFPTWTEMMPGIYIYSAFWINGKKIRTISVINSAKHNRISCFIWYQDYYKPRIGRAMIYPIKNKILPYPAFLDCEPLETSAQPFGVSFIQTSSSSLSSISVFPHNDSKVLNTSITACVSPLPAGFNNAFRIIEFIIYHHHIGVDHFIFYDMGIAPLLKKLIMQYCREIGIKVDLLPWNVPYSYKYNVSNYAYLSDCVYRSAVNYKSNFIMNISINHFVVPRNENLTVLLEEIQPTSENKLCTFSFDSFRFCGEYTNDIVANTVNVQFLTLQKTKRKKKSSNQPMLLFHHFNGNILFGTEVFHNLLLGNLSKFKVSPKHAVFHDYSECGENSLNDILNNNYISDNYMWKYKNLLYESVLYYNIKREMAL